MTIDYYHLTNQEDVKDNKEIDICTYDNINSYLYSIVKFVNVPKYIYVVEHISNENDIKSKYYIKTSSYKKIHGPYSFITFILGNYRNLITYKHSYILHEIRMVEIIKNIISEKYEYINYINELYPIDRNDLQLDYNYKCHYDDYDIIIILFNKQKMNMIEYFKDVITDDDIKKRFHIILRNMIKHKQHVVADYLEHRFEINVKDLLHDKLDDIYSYDNVNWFNISCIFGDFWKRTKYIYIKNNNIVHKECVYDFIHNHFWIVTLYNDKLFKYILKTGKYEAIKRGNIYMIKWLCENCGFDRSYFRRNDNKLLKIARKYNQIEIYEYINTIINRQ